MTNLWKIIMAIALLWGMTACAAASDEGNTAVTTGPALLMFYTDT